MVYNRIRYAGCNLFKYWHIFHLNDIPEISKIICDGGFALLGAPVAVHQELVVVGAFLHLVVVVVIQDNEDDHDDD